RRHPGSYDMMRLASSLNRVFTGPLDAAMYLDLHLIPVVLRVAVASKPVRATRNRFARLESHVDHLVAKPVWRMHRAARVREQDETLDALPVADRPITVHHVAKSANHGARRDCASVQCVSAAL